MPSVIHFRSAVAMAGRFPVLAGVDLEVDQGEVVLLQGPNGAGKTSLLRACAGLLRVVAGEAKVLGHDLVANPRAVRRRVGHFGHATGLYDDLTAAENVTFAVRAAGGDRRRVSDAMDLLGLTGRLATTPVASLSAGQRRRVALAGLVARNPELWLLDEPHAGLDADNRDLLDSIITAAVGRGATVLMASHEADRAVALAGRVVTVAGGAITGSTRSEAVVSDRGGDAPTPSGLSKLVRMKAQAHVA
jgi:heme ABC exporter ATP-binding subunit CcmA